MLRLTTVALGLMLAIPAFELIAHAFILVRVPPDADFRSAADFVRSELGPFDAITSAPAFTDPLLRLHLGDRIPLSMAGRSDDAGYERLWIMSIRGALPPDVPSGAPELERQFGRVRVLRYKLGKSRVLLDLVSALPSADVSIWQDGGPQRCPRRTGGVPHGGGLGRPVLMPIAERFECDPRRPWLFVGSVVMEDLSNTPRYCVWQHPQGNDPVTVRFSDVPLGDEIVFYGGVYYEHERMREGGPIQVDVYVDGRRRGGMTHRDGEGFRRIVMPSAPNAAQRGEVKIEVRAPNPDKRSFCWAASTRRSPTAPRTRVAPPTPVNAFVRTVPRATR